MVRAVSKRGVSTVSSVECGLVGFGYFGPIAILSDFIPVTNQINGELKDSKHILFIVILPSMVSLLG